MCPIKGFLILLLKIPYDALTVAAYVSNTPDFNNGKFLSAGFRNFLVSHEMACARPARVRLHPRGVAQLSNRQQREVLAIDIHVKSSSVCICMNVCMR